MNTSLDIRRVTDEVSVAPQIRPEDIPAIVAAGFRSIVCNRPDGEDPGQATFAEIDAAASAAALETRMMPVVSREECAMGAEGFGKLLEALPKPVLAYCRTGTRCAILWALSQKGARPTEEIIEATRAAGYDLAPLLDARPGA